MGDALKMNLYRIVLLFCLGFNVFSGNVYFRKSASGSNNGIDWTNAYTDYSAGRLARGDTGYVAGDASYYTGFALSVTASGTTLITIKKATVGDHGTSTGWNNSYGTDQAKFAGLAFYSSYWSFNGVSGGGPTTSGWTNGYGFKVANTNNVCIYIENTGNITLSHLDVNGNGPDGGPNANPNDLISMIATSASVHDVTVSKAWLHDAGRTLVFCNTTSSNIVFEYIYGGMYESTAGEHSEMISAYGAPSNWTVRWSIWTHCEGTGGIMFEGGDGYYVHGNIFVKQAGEIYSAGNGVVGSFSAAPYATGYKIYHNDFINSDATRIWGVLEASDLGEIKNNVVYASLFDAGQIGGLTKTHNSYFDVTGAPSGEMGYQSGTGSPFADYANWDFRPGAGNTFTTGAAVGAPYNVDMFGNTLTTRGAIEWTSSPQGGAGSGDIIYVKLRTTVRRRH